MTNIPATRDQNATNDAAIKRHLRTGNGLTASQWLERPELKSLPILANTERPFLPDDVAPTEWKSIHRQAFSHYLRTGRLVTMGEGLALFELKFNPNHDPANGQFTSGSGGGKDDWGLSHPSALQPVKGYPEDGKNAWRKANDQAFIKAAEDFNQKNGLKPGDPRYMDPQMMKAWAMVESGGDKSAFLSDPFQVNKSGDWADEKANFGLQKGEVMTPKTSSDAALQWLDMKGHTTKQLSDGSYSTRYTDLYTAFKRYNAKNSIDSNGKAHSVNYADKIFSLYDGGW